MSASRTDKARKMQMNGHDRHDSKRPLHGRLDEGAPRPDLRPAWYDGPGHYLLLAGFYVSVCAALQTLIILLTR